MFFGKKKESPEVIALREELAYTRKKLSLARERAQYLASVTPSSGKIQRSIAKMSDAELDWLLDAITVEQQQRLEQEVLMHILY